MCEWIVLLDSDNIIDSTYINTIKDLEVEEDVLYCPEKLYSAEGKVLWDYSKFAGTVIDKQNVKQYIGNEYGTCMNTGNYFFNKEAYLKVHEVSKIEPHLAVNDALYFSYLWLNAGLKIKVVKDLHYIHRVHPGSWYIANSKQCVQATKEIFHRMKQW